MKSLKSSPSSIPKVPNAINEKFVNIIKLIQEFCNKHLNQEYYDLSIKLAAKIARKRPSPLSTGKINTWAAAIIHAIGSTNFVFDKLEKPYIEFHHMEDFFDLSKSTISTKSKAIKDMFKIYSLDTKWMPPSRVDSSPLTWMVQYNGFIIDIRDAPYEIQLEALNAGVIPYIPDSKKG